MESKRIFKDYLAADEEEKLALDLAGKMIRDAIAERASDIHIEPHRTETVVKYRVDGLLRAVSRHTHTAGYSLVRMIKKLSALDPDLTDLPQDGRIRISLEGTEGEELRFDLRTATMPTCFGENLVIRILNPSNLTSILHGGLEYLGIQGEDLEKVREMITKPYGIVYFNGPTGSGKTTTLYAAINYLIERYKETVNIVTLEEPVEYFLDGVIQVPIDPAKGLTYVRGLKALMRQDPDIIFVGEVQDTDTVQMIVQAALTGHMVLSQLHRADTAHALKLLVELDMEPYLVGMSIAGVISQRLVRKICPNCKVEVHHSPEVLEQFRDDIDIRKLQTTYKGAGCKQCHGSGYQGRMAVYEFFSGNDLLPDLLAKNLSLPELRRELKAFGLKTLRQDALIKISEGLTTLEEAIRCTKV